MRYLILLAALIFVGMAETRSQAAEVSRPVILSRQILSDILDIHLSRQSFNDQVWQKKRQLSQVYQAIQTAENGPSARQRAEWLALRSEMLLLAFYLVDAVGQKLVRISQDLVRLEQEYRKAWLSEDSQVLTELPFLSEDTVLFEQQMSLVKSWVATVQSLKRFLAVERVYLGARYHEQQSRQLVTKL